MTVVPTVAWAAYRYLRTSAFSWLGRNPLGAAGHRLSWRDEYKAASALKRVHSNPPRLLETDSGGSTYWETPLGRFWAPEGADEVFVRLITCELVADVYRYTSGRTTPTRETVLDCGANIGMFTRVSLQGGARLVVAFEPSPKTAACYERTFHSEIRDGKIILIRKALWDRDETIFFNAQQRDNPASHAVAFGGPAPDSLSLPATRIDSVVRELGLTGLGFLKMDVEGAEVRALQGAAETIRRFRPLIGVGTEHTADLLVNTQRVMETIHAASPDYDYICTDTHPRQTPSRGLVMAPHCVYFYPKSTRAPG